MRCRRIRGQVLTQKIANFPEERLIADHSPFTFVGVNLFGPLLVKQGRSVKKVWGAIHIRAVHIKVAHSLDTSSFIQSLRRFVARRDQVFELRSNNDSKFVGAEHELAKAIENWNKTQIDDFLLQRKIKWKFNVPRASHHGEIWERIIRSFRKILSALCTKRALTVGPLSL